MFFMQPVVVNDAGSAGAAVDRPVAAEVRTAEPRTAAPAAWIDWTGIVLAQSSLDQRSPFGANAVDNNNRVTPGAATTPPVPPATSDNPDVEGSKAPATPSSTSAAEPGRPDAAPPVAGTGTTATPSATPGGAAGTGNASGTMAEPNNSIAPPTPTAPANINQPRSSTPPGTTLPGGSSGASNSR